MSTFTEPVIALARAAGAAIMQVYVRDFEVETKADHSPLTEADMASHHVIVDGLKALTPDVPVLSEESADVPWETRRQWMRYWLVDPLDGTREFVKKNGEFTVNIALIENGIAVFGVVFAPALDMLLHGERGVGAFVRDGDADVPVQTRRPAQSPLRVAASRSHLDARTAAAMERMGEVETQGMGSSLKFCRIAEGAIDIYPRFGPTSEWDTAAGQIIVEAAGGAVLDPRGRPFRYNQRATVLNGDFVAMGDARLPWASWCA